MNRPEITVVSGFLCALYCGRSFGSFLRPRERATISNRCLLSISMFRANRPSLRSRGLLCAVARAAILVALGTILAARLPALAQEEPGGTTGLPNVQLNPMPTTNGTLGLFTLETGEMLESGWSFSAYGNRFTRMPGSVIVSNYGLTVGWGFRKWLNFYSSFQPEVATQIGRPNELSLRTPPVVSAFPQFDSTIYRTLGPGQRPGYVEDYPFASRNDSGPGNVTLGVRQPAQLSRLNSGRERNGEGAGSAIHPFYGCEAE